MDLRVITGNAEVDLRPLNGATMLVWTGVAAAALAAVEETIIAEAIVVSLPMALLLQYLT